MPLGQCMHYSAIPIDCKITLKIVYSFTWYSTAQLQGNVRMYLNCLQDASKTRAGRVWDVHKTRPCKHETLR